MAFAKKATLRPLVFLLLGMSFFYLLYHSLAGGTLFVASSYDSYSLQAENWLAGHAYLTNGEAYPWLELAIYNGQYYLSFPPVPSVVLLPWVLLCGSAAAVPAHFVIALLALLTAAGVYCLLLRAGAGVTAALFWALFVTMGSNFCWLSTNGGVWFMAQVCNLCFVVWGFVFANTGRVGQGTLAAVCLALAVGCRPFSIVLLALFFLWVWLPLLKKSKNPLRWGAGFWVPFWVAAAIGGVMAWYNFIRFGSILEFGHNYLPEFMAATYGQFHYSYFWSNLKNIVRPITLTSDFVLEFSVFNGFFFLAANPIFLLWFIDCAVDAFRRKFSRTQAVLLVCWALGLAFLCLHKTMGGWQFGVRYMVDLIPYVLLSVCLRYRGAALGTVGGKARNHASLVSQSETNPKDWQWLLLSLAVMFNVYGAVYMLSC